MEQYEGNSIENVLYQGGPSQIINYNTFVLCIVIFIVAMAAPSIWSGVIVVNFPQYTNYKNLYMLASKVLFFLPIIWAAIAWLKVRNHRYIITSERLKEEEGILSKTMDELELFRVKDISFMQPFFLRMFGCGNIILDTSDKSTPVVILHAVKDSGHVMDILRKHVHIMRAKKGVREID